MMHLDCIPSVLVYLQTTWPHSNEEPIRLRDHKCSLWLVSFEGITNTNVLNKTLAANDLPCTLGNDIK